MVKVGVVKIGMVKVGVAQLPGAQNFLSTSLLTQCKDVYLHIDQKISIKFQSNFFVVLSIQENLVELAKDKTGSPMLYDLIEVILWYIKFHL